jgi:hypothetical protein
LDNANLFLRLDDPQSPKKNFGTLSSPSVGKNVDSPEGTIASSGEKEDDDDMITNPTEFNSISGVRSNAAEHNDMEDKPFMEDTARRLAAPSVNSERVSKFLTNVMSGNSVNFAPLAYPM